MEKMWGGRFEKSSAKIADRLNFSIGFDVRMFREDVEGSIAHAKMLGKQGIIAQSDADAIVAELSAILAERSSLELPEGAEDVHMAVEQLLTERIGEPGKRLHTARSRNDQVATDIRLHLRNRIAELDATLRKLLRVLANLAKAHLETVMPAYTHMQRAQPSTFAHWLMAYAQMFRRDLERLRDCRDRMNECPLGSGALCGTTYPIDREYVAAELGFDAVTQNSLDGVSDRDFALELLSALSIAQMHMSRIAEEIVLWCSWEFRFLELDDAFATGSSMMPQKKNPDVAEHIRGKTGRVYGALTTLLTVMKGLPLAYDGDMQEDKEALFDALDTVELCAEGLAQTLATASVLGENMRTAASRGFINATDCADYLVTKGVPFRDAHEIVGKLVRYCLECGATLETLTLDEYRTVNAIFEPDVFDAIALETCVERRSVAGGPARSSVLRQIEALEAFLNG